MALRTIQWATGSVGKAAIDCILNHPELELAGCWVRSKDKHGKDVGEIIGKSPLGVTATSSIEDILAIDADAVVYAPLMWKVDEVAALLRSGKDVVSPVGPIYPSERQAAPLAAACEEGNSRFHGTGIHPGGVTEVFPLMFSAMSSAVTFVRAEEFSDIRTYGAPDVVRDVMCFGGTREEAENGLMVSGLGSGFKQSIHMVLQALGLAGRAEIRTVHRVAVAARPIESPIGTIEPGKVAGQRFHWEAVDGEVVVRVGVTWLMGEESLDPAWSFGDQRERYEIEVKGNPDAFVTIKGWQPDTVAAGLVSSPGIVATAAHCVNSVPYVHAAPSGIIRSLELPLVAGRAHPKLASTRMDVDVDASGLLDGLDGQARQERAELILWLFDRGFSVEQIRTAFTPILLASNRVIGDDGTVVATQELAGSTGLSVELLQRLHRAVGLARINDPTLAVHPRADAESVLHAAKLVDIGFEAEEIVLILRLLMDGLTHAAIVMRQTALQHLLRPGSTELELAQAAEAMAHQMDPLLRPMVEDLLRLALRHSFQTEAVNATERASGALPNARDVAVAFADLVGFTRLGEAVGPEPLARLASGLGDRAREVAQDPVQFVKTIGAAVMFVSAEPRALLHTVLDLIDAVAADALPRLRVGVAYVSGRQLRGRLVRQSRERGQPHHRGRTAVGGLYRGVGSPNDWRCAGHRLAGDRCPTVQGCPRRGPALPGDARQRLTGPTRAVLEKVSPVAGASAPTCVIRRHHRKGTAMTTTHNTRIRRIVRTAMFSGALALAVSPFASLAIASAEYKESDFASCLDRDMPTDYCCEHAGGVMRNGACIDPEELLQPSDASTQPTTPTRRPEISTVPTGVFEQVTPTTRTPKPGSVVTAPITTATVK